ncbi:PilZ domain-containing protein [Paraburkholderia fungorum]|uniref:PilZ domain-containing protein n=1 Tax=Paraburkholderia fungorum TaxID=134537 RepID=UPI00344E67A4
MRREIRTPMLFPPTFLNRDGRGLAQVANLSSHGALLCARSALFLPGDTIAGWLQSLGIDGDEKFLVVVLNVRWARYDRKMGWDRLGCALQLTDEHSLPALRHLIENAGP